MPLNVKQLPWYYQVALFALLAAGALVAYFYYYERPTRAELATRQAKLDALRAEINRGRAIAQKLQEFQADVADLEARLDSLRAVLPEQKDVGDLLRRIQTLATQSNLGILAFKPQPVVNRQMHAEWPIALELEGSYHDLGMFFDKVSKVPRIINISNIRIRGRDASRGPRTADAGQRPSTILASCLATTFVLIEPSAAQADAKAPRPGGRPAPKPAPARPAAPRQ